MVYYCTTLVNGKPIGWTKYNAANLLYAKRSASYREKEWTRQGRAIAVAIEVPEGLGLCSTKNYESVDWVDSFDCIIYDKNMILED